MSFIPIPTGFSAGLPSNDMTTSRSASESGVENSVTFQSIYPDKKLPIFIRKLISKKCLKLSTAEGDTIFATRYINIDSDTTAKISTMKTAIL